MPEFAEQVGSFADKAIKRLELLQRKVSLEAFTEVILMSPVDTGRFRGNWQVAVGPQLSITSIPEHYVDPSGAQGIAEVSAVTATLHAGDTIWLVNNLPYARRLEYGWSQQAPGGMVRLTAQRWQPIVDKAVKEIAAG